MLQKLNEKKLSDIESDVTVLEKIDKFHSQQKEKDNDYPFLKSELHLFRSLEITIWYHLISPLSNEEKINELFHTMRTNLVERCQDLSKYLRVE